MAFIPDEWQTEVLQSDAYKMLLNCGRQVGKSTVVSILALHQVLFHPNSLVLVVSRSLRQSKLLFATIRKFLRDLPWNPILTEDNKLSFTLANGSSCKALPGSEATVRGHAKVDLLLEDEASRVNDDLYFAVRPMLAVSGGRHILLSSPFGKRGHFFRLWEEGGEAWRRWHIPSKMCPRISQEFLDGERENMPEAWYLQEYEAVFIEDLLSTFSYAEVMAAFDNEIAPLFEIEDLQNLSDLPPLELSV